MLGLVLFLLYINDIKESIVDNCELKLFADDALIYTTKHDSFEINE